MRQRLLFPVVAAVVVVVVVVVASIIQKDVSQIPHSDSRLSYLLMRVHVGDSLRRNVSLAGVVENM